MLLCENKQKPKLELCYENMRAPVPEPGSLNQGPGSWRRSHVHEKEKLWSKSSLILMMLRSLAMYCCTVCYVLLHTVVSVVPNRGAIYNTQGCRELMRFSMYH